MKQVFLHIGTPKTGTTSIQAFLEENSSYLARLGYLYSLKTNHHNLIYCLRKHQKYPNVSKDQWEKLEQEINTKDLEKIVISSEFFALQEEDIIAKVAQKLQKYQTTIIVYIKRQDKKVESSVSQTIKVGNFTGIIEEYLAKKGWSKADYLSMLDIWAKYFGKENIIVRPLEKQQIPNLYADFVKNLGIDSLEGFNIIKDRNIKPNIYQLTALQFLAQEISEKLDKKKTKFNRLLKHPQVLFRGNYMLPFLEYTSHWQGKTEYDLIPYEVKAKILEECAEQNAQIARQYLSREDGQLFYEPLSTYQHEIIDYNILTKEHLTDICSFLLLKDKNKTRKEIIEGEDVGEALGLED